MKKIIYVLAACAAFVLGANANEAEFVKNLKQSLNDKNAQLISIDKLNSLNGLNLLIVRSGDKKEAFLASDDAKSLVVVTEEPKLADAADAALFKMRTQILKDARDAAALEFGLAVFMPVGEFGCEEVFVTLLHFHRAIELGQGVVTFGIVGVNVYLFVIGITAQFGKDSQRIGDTLQGVCRKKRQQEGKQAEDSRGRHARPLIIIDV